MFIVIDIVVVFFLVVWSSLFLPISSSSFEEAGVLGLGLEVAQW